MKKLLRSLAVIVVLIITATNGLAFPKNNSGKGSSRQYKIQQMPEAMRKQMAEARDVVVARVNGSPITMESVLKMMNRIASMKRSKDIDMAKIKKEALDRIIFQELAYQRAVSEGMKPDKK